jgi:hypothetical protein
MREGVAPRVGAWWRTRLWSRKLPAATTIELQIGWPLLLLPFLLFGQLVTPHPVWIVLLVTIAALYAIGYAWVREQVQGVRFTRRRAGAILVAGDQLHEEFAVVNASGLPLLWAAFIDASDLPGYAPGIVVACGANQDYRWRTTAECARRGLFRLGPHRLELGDPLACSAPHRPPPTSRPCSSIRALCNCRRWRCRAVAPTPTPAAAAP